MTSIIIPTLNESLLIEQTLESVLAMTGTYEIIVVDGGSSDRTIEKVSAFPEVRIFHTKAGRAHQLNYGAAQARGGYLFFLHADTRPTKDCIQSIEHHLQVSKAIGGSFRMAFDDLAAPFRFLEQFTHFNSSVWTFGDQGLFVKKHIFDRIGGYASMPILEDLELQARLRKHGKFIKSTALVHTSARRYQQYGFWTELSRDGLVLLGYFLGVSPQRLSQWYRRKNKKVVQTSI